MPGAPPRRPPLARATIVAWLVAAIGSYLFCGEVVSLLRMKTLSVATISSGVEAEMSSVHVERGEHLAVALRYELEARAPGESRFEDLTCEIPFHYVVADSRGNRVAADATTVRIGAGTSYFETTSTTTSLKGSRWRRSATEFGRTFVASSGADLMIRGSAGPPNGADVRAVKLELVLFDRAGGFAVGRCVAGAALLDVSLLFLFLSAMSARRSSAGPA